MSYLCLSLFGVCVVLSYTGIAIAVANHRLHEGIAEANADLKLTELNLTTALDSLSVEHQQNAVADEAMVRRQIKIELQRAEIMELQRQIDKNLRGEGVSNPAPVRFSLEGDGGELRAMRLIAALLTITADAPVTITHSDLVGVEKCWLWEQHNRDGSVTYGVKA